MSSDILYSTKNYRNDWISQFGLYRYESAASSTGEMYASERKRLAMRVTLLLGSTFCLAILIIYMAIYMGNYSDVDRMIILSKLEESESLNPPLPPPSLTTIFYPDEQISAYHHVVASTTPLPAKKPLSINQRISTSSMNGASASTAAVKLYPSNHKRRYSKVYREHGNEFTTAIVQPTITAKYTEHPQKRIFFPTFDDYDDDFVDISYPKANNIQEILNQSTNIDEMENIMGDSDGVDVDMVNDLIMPSMPFSRTMKVEGIYRREKVKRDQLSTMETAIQAAHMHPPHTYNKNAPHKFDPFSKFKPSSPSDVNLLAASSVTKLKSYTHHKPRPLATPAIATNKYSGDYSGSNSDPNVIYHRIASATRNSRYEKPVHMNTKPFSLMLDVYPMSDDESPQHIKHMPPYGSSSSSASNRRPIYPVNSHAINNNLQYNKDSNMYNPLKYPQLQPYPYNRSPYALNPTAKEGYMQNYAIQRMNAQATYGPAVLQPLSHRTITSGSGRPSQITVHLNLYPDRKKMRNVEIVNTNTVTTTIASADDDSTTAIASSIDDHPHTLWKRLERPINTTVTKLVDAMRNGRIQTIKPYIPPFSAIKINSFQHEFDDMNESASTLLPIKQPDKMVEDLKKLSPNITKAMSYINPSSLPSSSTSSASFDNNNDIPSISMESMTSEMSNQFASTMSSSTTATSTFYITPINQVPFASTNTPSTFQMTTPTMMTTMANTITDSPNESDFDQTTSTYTI